MKRHTIEPRENWRATVEEQGLGYAVDRNESGEDLIYWDESAQYELSSGEVKFLETVTDELHEMSVAACKYMLDKRELLDLLQLPLSATMLMRGSLENEQNQSIYGRFDLAYWGDKKVKLLEYNADTPAALFEGSVTQWYWLEDTHPEHDQWNLLHERLVHAWPKLVGDNGIHFAVGQNEPTEDWVTVAYLRDTVREAGLKEFGVVMEEIGWDANAKRFVDNEDNDIATLFKMYPWDWLLREDFGAHVMAGEAQTKWIEPAWKTLAGSKALLVALWDLYPNHPYLLQTTTTAPTDGGYFVAKPVFGWEGAGIEINAGTKSTASGVAHTKGQPVIYQDFVDLPNFDGNFPVLGTWIIDGQASGLGIRESTSLITDSHARFVPHFINAPRATDEDIASWVQ